MGESSEPEAGSWKRRREWTVRDHEELNRRRIRAGLSHAHLAARVGCSKSYAGFLCTGSRSGVSKSMGLAIAEALGCKDSPEELFDIPADEPAESGVAEVGAPA